MDIKKILVPSDFSAYAEHALTWVVRLAQQAHAEILLVYAVPIFPHLSYTEVPILVDIPKIEAELDDHRPFPFSDFPAESAPPDTSARPNGQAPASLQEPSAFTGH